MVSRIHVPNQPPVGVRKVVASEPNERLELPPVAGQPPGRYDAAIGGQVELDGNGRLGLVGTPYLAGAARPLLACVATAMHDAGLTLPEALGCASTVPAALFGLPALAVGAPAHLLRFHRHACGALCPVETIVAGHSISP